MPNKKHSGNIRHSAAVVAARAGLIPASDDIEDELNSRVARAGRMLSTNAKREQGCHDLAIIDILEDLRHYCDAKGLPFHELDAAAHHQYLEYVAESPWVARPFLGATTEVGDDVP